MAGIALATMTCLTTVVTPQSANAQTTDPKIKAALKDPATLKEKAPTKFQAKFETSKGDFYVDVNRSWSPNGADRFYNLVKNGFFNNIRFFRVVPGFVVQFGIHGDPDLAMKWLQSNIPDDEKVVKGNMRGFMTFAKSGAPNSRSTQIFINLRDNERLDSMGFSAFAQVTKGMDVVDKLYDGYGEQITQLQVEIAQGGNAYLAKEWPKLDYIKQATIVK